VNKYISKNGAVMIKLLVFVIPVYLMVYLGYGWKFWYGFRWTTYHKTLSNQIKLTLLWPVLFCVHRRFRRNFKRAMRQY
jgi:cell shape-determining protein MreD